MNNTYFQILDAGSDYVTYTELENSPELVLTIHFVGDADQVTQLFPQNILRDMGYPLDIQVTLKVRFFHTSRLSSSALKTTKTRLILFSFV